MLSGNMSKTSTKFINEKSFEERVKEKGGFIITNADEPCFTCGRKKQMVYPEKTDGRVDIIRVCMFCLVKHPTKANREIV
jgi:hypothetical protein